MLRSHFLHKIFNFYCIKTYYFLKMLDFPSYPLILLSNSLTCTHTYIDSSQCRKLSKCIIDHHRWLIKNVDVDVKLHEYVVQCGKVGLSLSLEHELRRIVRKNIYLCIYNFLLYMFVCLQLYVVLYVNVFLLKQNKKLI